MTQQAINPAFEQFKQTLQRRSAPTTTQPTIKPAMSPRDALRKWRSIVKRNMPATRNGSKHQNKTAEQIRNWLATQDSRPNAIEVAKQFNVDATWARAIIREKFGSVNRLALITQAIEWIQAQPNEPTPSDIARQFSKSLSWGYYVKDRADSRNHKTTD